MKRGNPDVESSSTGGSDGTSAVHLPEQEAFLPKGRLLLPRPVALIAAYLYCVGTWGTTWFAIRLCVAPGGFTPFMAAAMRFTAAGTVLGVLFVLGVVRPRRSRLRGLAWVALSGLLAAIGFGLVYTAERSISGAMAAILNATSPWLVAIIATATGIERVSGKAIVGSLVAMAGIVTIFWNSLHASPDQALGVCMMLGSAAVAAINNVIMKRHAGDQGPFVSVAIVTLVCASTFWLSTLVVEHPQVRWPLPLVPSLAALYLGVASSILATGAYFYLIKHIRLMTLSTVVFFPPIIAMGVDALWERALTPGVECYLGMAITLAGVAITVLSPQSRSR